MFLTGSGLRVQESFTFRVNAMHDEKQVKFDVLDVFGTAAADAPAYLLVLMTVPELVQVLWGISTKQNSYIDHSSCRSAGQGSGNQQKEKCPTDPDNSLVVIKNPTEDEDGV